MKLAFSLMSACCSLLPSVALASDDDVTTKTTVGPVFQDGELQGCDLVFDVAHRDLEYHQGQLVHVAGSLNYYVWPDRSPVISIKIGIQPLQNGNASFIAPAEVFLVVGTKTNKGESLTSVSGELPGFRIFAFQPTGQSLESLMAIGENGRLHLGYAMKPGGMLSLVDIDAKVKELNFDAPERSDIDRAAPRRWLDCVHEATELALRRMKQK